MALPAYNIELKVRDYECDIQGIVNNSVYQNYLEHARHEYLIELGLNFTELAHQGVNLVVTRAELDYKTPLRSGDRFRVTVSAEKHSRLRGKFVQKIIRCSDEKLAVDAVIYWTSINEKGRPFFPDAIAQLIASIE